jgi:hypothetical protein
MNLQDKVRCENGSGGGSGGRLRRQGNSVPRFLP